VIEPTLVERLERETPTRAVVRSGADRLLVFPTSP
jgi:hypothetical protein